MSHPIPQEVEEKIEYGVGKIMGALPTHLSSEDYRDIQIVSRQALLSVYNSGREAVIEQIRDKGTYELSAYEWKGELLKDLSAPSSEDNA